MRSRARIGRRDTPRGCCSTNTTWPAGRLWRPGGWGGCSGTSAASRSAAFAEADQAYLRGDLDAALAHARRMTEIGQRCDSPDLVAIGLQAQGRMLLSQGNAAEGLTLLDEAMCAVVAGELSAAPVTGGAVWS